MSNSKPLDNVKNFIKKYVNGDDPVAADATKQSNIGFNVGPSGYPLSNPSPYNSNPTGEYCHNCGDFGHLSSHCQNPPINIQVKQNVDIKNDVKNSDKKSKKNKDSKKDKKDMREKMEKLNHDKDKPKKEKKQKSSKHSDKSDDKKPNRKLSPMKSEPSSDSSDSDDKNKKSKKKGKKDKKRKNSSSSSSSDSD